MIDANVFILYFIYYEDCYSNEIQDVVRASTDPNKLREHYMTYYHDNWSLVDNSETEQRLYLASTPHYVIRELPLL